MKTKIQILFLALAFLAGSVRAAVTLTVTPSAISNTYNGVITLDLAGLTNGEMVAVQKYFDLNGNGAVDSGEPMMDAFKVKDGGANVIGGVTNLNVPFDSNSATGAITTKLGFAPPRTLANTVAQYVFRVVSPGNNFTPVTAVFTVTNAALAQSLSGVVYSNGVTPLPHAVVVALQSSASGQGNGRYAGAAMADNSGHYQLNLDPGIYVFIATFPGYYMDQSLAPQVALTSGLAATNNFSLTRGIVTVSGTISDAINLAGQGGLMIQVESGNFFAVAFTDTNGDYSADVSPAVWGIKVDSGLLAQRAYVLPRSNLQADTTTGNVANVSLALPRTSAMFHGRIADTNNVPFANISFNASDIAGQFEAEGCSDDSGNYCVAIIGGTNEWNCNPDISSPPLSSYIVSSVSSTNLTPGQALLQSFTVIPASAQISGHLQDNLGNALANIGINVSASINGVQFGGYVDTDNSGNYTLAAATGVWNLNVTCCGSYGLSQFGLIDPNPHVVTIPPTNAVVNIIAYPPGPLTLVGGALPRGYVSASYNFSIGASGGQPPYVFSLAPGSDLLPPGLFLSSDGFITGAPTSGGTFNFNLRVTDQTTAHVDASFSMVVDPLLGVVTTSLTNGAVTVGYSAQLEATGGVPPYLWLLATNSSVLPPGLTLTTNGLLSGIPSVADTYNIVVQVFDNAGHTAIQALPLVITTTNPPPAGMLLSAPVRNADGSFQFGFMSAPGVNYTIQYSSDLSTWTSVLSFQSPGGSMLIVDPNAAGSSRRFYRVKIGP